MLRRRNFRTRPRVVVSFKINLIDSFSRMGAMKGIVLKAPHYTISTECDMSEIWIYMHMWSTVFRRRIQLAFEHEYIPTRLWVIHGL